MVNHDLKRMRKLYYYVDLHLVTLPPFIPYNLKSLLVSD